MLQPRLLSVTPQPNGIITLVYETGEKRLFDVKPYIQGSFFGKLSDEAYFRTVHIVQDGYGIEWADGQDIAPHELYENGTLLP